jgi:hypothetical protein
MIEAIAAAQPFTQRSTAISNLSNRHPPAPYGGRKISSPRPIFRSLLDGIIKADAAAHPDNRGGNDNFIDRIAGMKERNADNNFGSVAVPANSNLASYRNLVVMLGETDGSSIIVRSFLGQQKQEDIVRIIAAFATKKQEAAKASKTMWDANE